MNSLPKSYAPLVHLDAMRETDRIIGNIIARVIAKECRHWGEEPGGGSTCTPYCKKRKRRDHIFAVVPPGKRRGRKNQPRMSRASSASTQKYYIERWGGFQRLEPRGCRKACVLVSIVSAIVTLHLLPLRLLHLCI